MTPEFSRPIAVERIGETDTVHEIVANLEERAALAQRFGLLGLDRLEARLVLRRAKDSGGRVLKLTGSLSADVVQACVVTLSPVPGRLDHEFTVLYGAESEGTDVVVGTSDDETVEPWPEGSLDIGEAVAQELALALDPYPRAPGAAIGEAWKAEDGTGTETTRPFAGLDRLRGAKS